MTKKPGLKARSKSIKAAMTAARGGEVNQSPPPSQEPPAEPTTVAVASPTPERVVVQAAVRARSLMPQDDADVRILEERAEIYARPPKLKRAARSGDAFVQIGLGTPDRYGLPFEFADEIVVAGEITPVPGVPAHVAGVINLRGTLLTVVDIRPLLGLDSRPFLGDMRVVVLSGEGMRFGVLASEVDGTVSFGTESLAQPIGGTGQGKNFVRGIHGGRIAVIDVAALMEAPALVVDQGLNN